MSIIDQGVSTEKLPGLETAVVVSDDKLKAVREAVAIGASFKEICYYADVPEDALKKFLEQNPRVSESLDLLAQRPILRARQTLDKAIGEDPAMALRFLERKRPEEFAPSSTVRTQHTVQHKLDPAAERKLGELAAQLNAALRAKLVQPLEVADRAADVEGHQPVGGGVRGQDGDGSPA